VCRDSGFSLDLHRACALAAKVLGKHPLDVWMAMPSLDVMFEIAAGAHPAAQAMETRQGEDPQGLRAQHDSAVPSGMRPDAATPPPMSPQQKEE
jgi:hypothetical protein